MDYKLKNRDGVETTYTKEKLKIPAATGDSMVVFTQGEVQAEKTVTITENGTTEVIPDAGYGSVKKVGVTVDVPTSAPVLQKKSISITSNGTGSVLPDAGKDGLSEVDYTVAVPSPTLVDKTVELSFPYDPALETNVNMQVTPENGTAFSSVDISVPSNLHNENIKAGVPIAGITGTYRDETPKALNHEGINFISWDGTVVETWTLEELATKTVLPEVPNTLKARTSPLMDGNNIRQPESGGLVPSISSTLFWNSTLAELKKANEPANVGLCYACNRSGIGYGLKTYNIALAPHIVVLELPHAMDFTLKGRFRFWDNGLGKRVNQPTNTLSFPYAGEYCVQYWIRTEVEAKQIMITEEMRPYVKAIIFPMADKDKMSIGSTSHYFKTDFQLMSNPYYKCPNIKTVAFSPRCGGAGIYEGPADWDVNGFFLSCYSLETVSIPVAPNGYNGNGFRAETTFLRVPVNEIPYGAMSYNLKNIIVPKAATSRMNWANCIGGIEAIVFNGVGQVLSPGGVMPQSWIESNQNTVVPWPNLKLIDLSRAAGDVSDFYLLFGKADSQYMKLKLPAGKSITIKVPASQLDAYKTADGWKDFADYIVGV